MISSSCPSRPAYLLKTTSFEGVEMSISKTEPKGCRFTEANEGEEKQGDGKRKEKKGEVDACKKKKRYKERGFFGIDGMVK